MYCTVYLTTSIVISLTSRTVHLKKNRSLTLDLEWSHPNQNHLDSQGKLAIPPKSIFFLHMLNSHHHKTTLSDLGEQGEGTII